MFNRALLNKTFLSNRPTYERDSFGSTSRPPRHDLRIQRLLPLQQRRSGGAERHRQPRRQENPDRRFRRAPRSGHPETVLRQLQGKLL
jgi:hypothetical protein